MRRRRYQSRRRRGGTLLETGVVILMTLMIVLGVFEYGRLLMVGNVLDNAAREGCRFALANNTDTNISSEVQTLVTNYMGGQQTAALSNFTVTVSGVHQGAATAVNNLQPGDLVSVTVSGTYHFMNVIPLIKMPTNYNLSSSVTMVCEGGT